MYHAIIVLRIANDSIDMLMLHASSFLFGRECMDNQVVVDFVQEQFASVSFLTPSLNYMPFKRYLWYRPYVFSSYLLELVLYLTDHHLKSTLNSIA